MDSRIIYYPPKIYFRNMNVPRAATKLRYVGTNFKVNFGIHRCKYKFFGRCEQGLQRKMDKLRLPRITELPSIQNQGAPNMIGSTAALNGMIRQLLIIGNTWFGYKGCSELIINISCAALMIRPAEGQAMCVTNGISSVKVWPMSSFGSIME